MTARPWAAVALLALGCGAPGQEVRPSPAPTPAPSTPPVEIGLEPGAPGDHGRVAPPEAAWRAGWMPRDATAADRFVVAHPAWDGRGVIIAILDSGLDPTIPGLQRTTTGDRKVLDLRDFSGEGRLALARAPLGGTRITAGGVTIDGAVRLRGFAVAPEAWVGQLAERPLGDLPASDLNGNGTDTDSLAVVVVRGPSGWLFFADTNLDGSFGDERPIRDYAVAGETFCWGSAPTGCPVGIGVNLADSGDEPGLSLVFDTSGHGSHVAGIAAGHDLYDVAGFDGVAPGAWLLGLKIADNANGGISATGSMVAALAHAIGVARQRHAPLVVNMSFGVGNEVEGQARIDGMIDSILAANPDVVMTVSAGNDGPGLSTLGFPGSATRPIAVGATFPVRFVERTPDADRRPDPVAYFSSRGGELAKPDLVTPGIAYSTVPGWDRGQERNAGTSMASPHAAGLAALLVSGLHAEGRPVDAVRVRQALMATARPTPGATWLDEGAGLPDVGLAWAWLGESRELPVLETRVGRGPWGRAGVLVVAPPAAPAETTIVVEIRRADDGEPVDLTLSTESNWLHLPSTVRVGPQPAAVRLAVSTPLSPATWQTTLVTARSADRGAGALLRLPVTVVSPLPADQDLTVGPLALPPGGVARVFFASDSGRPFEAAVTSEVPGDMALTSLHAPGGMPYVGENGLPAAGGERGARYPVEGGEAWPGVWELVAVPPPGRAGKVSMNIRRAPLLLAAREGRDRFEVVTTSVTPRSQHVEAGLVFVGVTRSNDVTREGSDRVVLPLDIPDWAVDVQVDATVPDGAWGRFTDLGITLEGGDGRQVEHTPLGYPRGRLTAPLGREVARRGARLVLIPGLADSLDAAPWTVLLSVRFYAERTVEPEPLQVGPRELAAGAELALEFDHAALPWSLVDGWRPLAVSWARTDDDLWTAEGALGGAP